MTEPEAFNRMRELDNTEKFSYAEKGRICLIVKMNILHRQRINPMSGEPLTLTEWIKESSPWGYSGCFAAMRDMESLSDMKSEDLMHVPESNFAILKQLSTQVRSQPEVVQAAKTLRSNEFVEHIQKAFPEQHLETNSLLRFMANQTQKDEIEEAIDLAMSRGAMSRTEALVDLATNYKADVLLEQLQKENV